VKCEFININEISIDNIETYEKCNKNEARDIAKFVNLLSKCCRDVKICICDVQITEECCLACVEEYKQGAFDLLIMDSKRRYHKVELKLGIKQRRLIQRFDSIIGEIIQKFLKCCEDESGSEKKYVVFSFNNRDAFLTRGLINRLNREKIQLLLISDLYGRECPFR
jgi:hypothetical protein